jgi:hypothetical protein
LKKAGEPSKEINRAQATALTKLGISGIKVAIMPPTARIYDRIEVNDAIRAQIKMIIPLVKPLVVEEKKKTKIAVKNTKEIKETKEDKTGTETLAERAITHVKKAEDGTAMAIEQELEEGVPQDIIDAEMKEKSENLEYEKAAKLRDTIQKIEHILEKQIIVSNDPYLNQDIFACAWKDNYMVLELLLVREGKIIAVESLTITIPKDTKIEDAFTEAIKQYYARVEDENIPGEIIVQFELKEKEKIEEWLSSKIIYPKKGKKLNLVKMAEQNAKLALEKYLISNFYYYFNNDRKQ